MHIEPGVVDGAKILLSIGTAAAAIGLGAKMAWTSVREDGGIAALGLRSVAATVAVFGFFEVLPHYPVGVSEVHLILGSTLFLLLGAGPAAIGLALGLLAQGLFVAPFDVPLYAMSLIARRVIPARTAYKDISYGQALALSTSYQAGIVAWVGFWAVYGGGFGAETLASISTFGAAYLIVIAIEPLVDLAILAGVKTFHGARQGSFFPKRLHRAAA